jgi:putative ATP-dependent endonuclease of the OLD family
MRIARLRIKNFRSIQKLDFFVPQVCALVGPNNSGKSNILLAIHRVLGRDWVSVTSFDESDVYARDSERDVRIDVSFDPPLEYAKFKESAPVTLATLSFQYTRYKIGGQKGQRRLEQKTMDGFGKAPFVVAKAPRKDELPSYQPLVGIPSEVRESVPLIYVGTNRSLKEHLPGARYSLLRTLFEDIARGFEDPEQTVVVTKADGKKTTVQRSKRFEQLMGRALDLLRTDEFGELEKAIKRNALGQLGFDPDVDVDKLDLFFSPFDAMSFYKSLDLRVNEGDFSISATELGEGMQNAIVLAILQAFEERRKQGAILLIEEPEMFLHPQMQRSLYKTLRRIGETNQVIYTTHSPHFVAVPDYDQVRLVRKESSGTTVMASDLPIDKRRREKLIKELDPERNELFFANRLLLVEGDTEKLAMPVYASRLKLDLDHAGATIVEVGGKRNLPEFIAIAKSFGIPTGAVYDEDASDFKDRRVEEKEFNQRLDGEARADGTVRVWKLSRNYEDNLRRTLGDTKYQKLCQQFARVPKPTRARLIAYADEPIPRPIDEILRWLTQGGE